MKRIATGLGLLGVYAAAQALSGATTGLLGGRDGTEQSRRVFRDLPTPSWAPPAPVYGVVWSGLAVTSTAAAWRVRSAGAASPDAGGRAARALGWWAAALLPRSAYTPLAFGERRLWLATADSALLALTWAGFTRAAWRVDRVAAALAAPELVWSSFATVLSAVTARRDHAGS